MNFSWIKTLGLGALLWLIMFAVVSALVGLNIYANLWVQLLTAVLAGLVAFFMSPYLHSRSAGQALSYGLVWVVVGLLLDWLVTYRFDNTIFVQASLWLGNVLVVVAPWLQYGSSRSSMLPTKSV